MNGSDFNPRLIQEKCQKAGVPFWTATEVVIALKGKIKPGMSEDEIDEAIINELKKRDENAAKAYENYHRIYVRTSNGELEPFDKEKIVISLVKETMLPKGVCEEIANEVESDIRRLELRYLSASLVRDIVNSKLLERKYLKARAEYSRIGLPLHDVHRIIETANANPRNPEAIHRVFGDSIAREYSLVKLLPQEITKAHLTGFIHIHDLPYFATKITSLQNDLRWFLLNGLYIDENTTIAGPPRHADTVFSHLIRILVSGSTQVSGGISFDFFNLFVAPYTINLSNSELDQLIQGFIYELNQLQGVKGGRVALGTLNFELEAPSFIKKEKAILPGGVTSIDTYPDYEREAARVLNSFLGVMSKGDYAGKPFQMPKIVIKVRDGPIPNNTLGKLEEYLKSGNTIRILNLRTNLVKENANIISPNHMLIGKKKKWFETIRTGVLQEVSINMPYIGIKAKDEVEFFDMLEAALNYAKKACQIKKGIIEKRMTTSKILPFLSQEKGEEKYFQIDNAVSLVSLVGLDSAIKEFRGEEISRSEDSAQFADKVISFVKSKLDAFLENEAIWIQLANSEAKRVKRRFSQLNMKNFGIKDIYANTFTNPMPDLVKWGNIERELQTNSLGGNSFDVQIRKYAEQRSRDPSAKLVYDIMDNAPISFRLTW